MIYPHHDKFFEDYPVLSNKVEELVELISVARVSPRHLRASQTCYCLKLPFALIQIVPLRSIPGSHPHANGSGSIETSP